MIAGQENTPNPSTAVALNLNSIIMGSHQPQVLAVFYEQVFGRPADMEDGDWHGWNAGGAFVSIGSHSEVNGPAQQPARIMLGFETRQVKEEFERLRGIGATLIKEPYEMGGTWIATVADPDGNYLQLMTPWE